MFISSKMRYLQLVVLERDFNRSIDYLGEFGWVEINRKPEDKKNKIDSMNNINESIDKNFEIISDFFQIYNDGTHGELRDIAEINSFFDNIVKIIKPYKDKYDELNTRKKELEDGIKELSQFKNLSISKSDLEGFAYIHFAVGSLLKNDIEYLNDKLKDRIVIIELEKDLYIIFTSKKGKWTLESELKKISFKEKKIPGENSEIPKQALESLTKELQSINERIDEIENFKKEYMKKYTESIYAYLRSFNLQKVYFDIHNNLKRSDSIAMIEGWVLDKKVKTLTSGLSELLGDNHSIVTYKPEEVDDVKKGIIKVPVFMENNPFIKPFESLIFNYGTPVYGTIDPTIFVTFSFLLFFGMMYGDIGQGLVIFLLGLFLQISKKQKDAGFIVSCVGISAMIFGYLYGSIFCFESHELEFIFRPINKTLFGLDRAYIIDLSPENSLNIFFATVGFGLLVNLSGILINIINNIIKKRIDRLLFGHTGIAGFVMLLSISIILVQALILKKSPGMIFIILIIVSMILIFLKEPLNNLITGHRPIFHEGVGMWIFLSFVELFEVMLSTISNNLSFIRVGAFAFAHAILSFTTIQLAEILGGKIASPGGIIVLIIGNIVIIGLEGMIVGIQTIRLEYYEFFSKFFSEQGKQFIPFKINKLKMEESK